MNDAHSALAALGNSVVALQANGRGAYVAELVRRLARGEADARQEVAAAIEGARAAVPQLAPIGNGNKSVAVVSVKGVALYGVELQPFAFSTARLAETVTALAADPQIAGIVLDINSPGGVVTGTPEAADAIYAARQRKPVVAFVDPLAASAAYWIASQASAIVMVGSGDVGSIGVFLLHVDFSAALEMSGVKPTFIFDGKFKTEGNPYQPLSQAAQEYLQGQVATVGTDFRRAVARGRGLSTATVAADFGQGRTLTARDALRAKMVDRVGDLALAVRLAAGGGRSSFPASPSAALSANEREAEALRHRLELLSPDTAEDREARARRRRLELLRHG